MPGQVEIQTIAVAADQFTGLAGAGLFEFSEWDAAPLSTRIVLSAVAYASDDGGGAVSGNVEFYLRPPAGGGGGSERILLGRGLQADITGPDGRGDFSVCGKAVPRLADGRHWQLHAVTVGKDAVASVIVDWVLMPFPDTSDRDSSQP